MKKWKSGSILLIQAKDRCFSVQILHRSLGDRPLIESQIQSCLGQMKVSLSCKETDMHTELKEHNPKLYKHAKAIKKDYSYIATITFGAKADVIDVLECLLPIAEEGYIILGQTNFEESRNNFVICLDTWKDPMECLDEMTVRMHREW